MRRFVTLAVLFLFTIPFGISISGCSKKSNFTYCSGDSGPVVGQAVAITLTPRIYGISLNFGQFGQVATPSAVDCKGTPVSISNYTYGLFDANGNSIVGLTNNIADVIPTGASAGRLCGGTWNRNTGGGIADYTTCIPTNKSGTVYVVASASNVSSNSLPIFVHPVATSVVLGSPSANCATDPDPSSNCCPLAQEATVTAPSYDANSCLSQGHTGQIVARVYDASHNNITCQVGHLSYTWQPTEVVSIDENGVATAQQPGSATVTANVSNASSSAGFFSTCPPVSIDLTVANSGGKKSALVNQNTTQPLTAVALDKYGVTLTGLNLTYQSTNPIPIPAASTGSVTPVFPGAAAITAICQPPACNPSPLNGVGFLGNGKPVSSNEVTITTPGTNSTLLYIASTQSLYIVPVDFTTSNIGTPVRLPYIPNSMVISNDGANIYMGTDNEIMTFNASANSLSKEDTTVAGKVLAVSPDGSTLVITDPKRNLIYLYSSTGSVSSTYGGVATHAEFTPDSNTVYITTGTVAGDGSITPSNQLLVHSSFTGWSSVSLATPATDVAVTVPSVGAYLSGSSTTARSYCPSTTVASDQSVTSEYYPLADTVTALTDTVAATNDGLHILGATASGGPSIIDLGFNMPGLPPPPSGGSLAGACPDVVPPNYFTGQRNSTRTVAMSDVTATSINQIVTASDSSVAFVTYNGSGSLPAYSPATGTVTPVTLTGTATAPVAAAISSDNATLYVGTSGDNDVHQIDVKSLTDNAGKVLAPKLPDVNGNIVTPNLIVQHPKKTIS